MRYGSDEEVRRQLTINLNTGMITETEEQKRERFVKLRSQEENSNVRRWIDEYIGLSERFGKFLRRLDEREFAEQSEPESL